MSVKIGKDKPTTPAPSANIRKVSSVNTIDMTKKKLTPAEVTAELKRKVMKGVAPTNKANQKEYDLLKAKLKPTGNMAAKYKK